MRTEIQPTNIRKHEILKERELARWSFPLGGKYAELRITGIGSIEPEDIDSLITIAGLFRRAMVTAKIRRQENGDYEI